MSGEAEWGPWVEHDGRGCPVPDGVICHRILNGPARGNDVRVLGAMEDISPVEAIWESKAWYWWPGAVWVIRYRIRRPKALRDLIALVENLPAPVAPVRLPEEVA